MGLGQRGDRRVVVDEDGELEALGEDAAQRHVLQRDVDRVARGAGREVDDRRDADADGVGRAGALDQLGELVDQPLGAVEDGRAQGRLGELVPSSTATETLVPPTSTPMNRCAIASAPSHAGRSGRVDGYCRDRCRLARPPTTWSLVERAREGDEEAFALLVRRYSPMLLRLARMYVPTDALAEDVVQETWVAVVRGLERFEGRSSFKTWLFRILVNRAKTRGVREHRSIPFASVGGAAGPSAEDGDEGPTVDPARFTSEGAWTSAPADWRDDPEAGAGLGRGAAGRPRGDRRAARAPEDRHHAARPRRAVVGRGAQRLGPHGDQPTGPPASCAHQSAQGAGGLDRIMTPRRWLPWRRRPAASAPGLACRELVELVTEYLEGGAQRRGPRALRGAHRRLRALQRLLGADARDAARRWTPRSRMSWSPSVERELLDAFREWKAGDR